MNLHLSINSPLLNIYSDASYPYLKEWSQYGNNAKFLDSDNPNYTNIHYEGFCNRNGWGDYNVRSFRRAFVS